MATDDQDEYGFVPVSFKPACRLGAQVMPSAKNLANNMGLMGQQSANRVRNGFLIRAVRLPQVTNVHIIDPPAMLLMAGWCSYPSAQLFTVNNGAAPVGNRDDFSPPGYSGDGMSIASRTWLQIGAPGEPPSTDASEPLLTYCHMQPVVFGEYVMLGYMRIPTTKGYAYINDQSTTMFTNANTVRVGCGYRYPRVSLGAVDAGGSASQYLALNSFWVSEGDLPSGWRFLPRRLASVYTGNAYIQDVVNWGAWTPGASVIPASGESGDNTDQFMIAVQCVKQVQDTWTSSGRTYFDQQGQRSLMLLKGALDVPAVEPSAQLYATLSSSTPVLATDIDQSGLHPAPETYQVTANGPSLVNYAYFLQPQVQRCSDGFVTFCTYRAPYQKTGEDGASTGDMTLYAVLVVTPDGKCMALKGDIWANSIASYDATTLLPTIADTNTTYSTVPWIVGSESVETTANDGAVTRTAYALVWEEHRSRSTTTQTGYTDGVKQYQSSWTLGGEWALYSLESGTPVRTVLPANDITPLFTPLMSWDKWFPTAEVKLYTSQSLEDNQSNLHTTFSSLYSMGRGKLVTAAILATVTLNNQMWLETSSQSGGFTGHCNLVAHDVYCAVLDTAAGTLTKKGVICSRSDSWYYCHISVAQPEVAADAAAGTAAKPACLIASIYSTAPDNYGIQNSKAGLTTLYVSIDGGDTWKLYSNDMAAPNGAFLIGNQLWANDVTSRYDEGLAG